MSKKPINKKTLLLIEKQNNFSMNSNFGFILSVGYILEFQNQLVFFFFFFFLLLVLLSSLFLLLASLQKQPNEIICLCLTQVGPPW